MSCEIRLKQGFSQQICSHLLTGEIPQISFMCLLDAFVALIFDFYVLCPRMMFVALNNFDAGFIQIML